jgi:hypothetical protein
VGGVEGAAWGVAEVVGSAPGATEVGEVCDEGVAHGMAVGLATSARGGGGGSDLLGSRSDRQPLFWARSDYLDVRSNHSGGELGGTRGTDSGAGMGGAL